MALRTAKVLTSLTLLALAAPSCGSDDGKKKAFPPDAGADAADASMDATGADASFTPEAGPDVQDEPEPDAGVDAPPDVGVDAPPDAPPDVAPDVPDAGTPVERELLFSVSVDSQGIAGTALANEANPQSSIFSSTSGVPDDIDGTNQLVLGAAALGLASTDEIRAFTVLRPLPETPLFLFSVDGGEGAHPTRLYFEYWDGEPSGDVYFSDGVTSYRDVGEGGDQYGYNALLADETSLGLAPPDETELANLQGLLVREADETLSEVYFTVTPGSVGATGSAVETATAAERACTIFRSALDGTNTVAFTCASLGLAADAQVDALAVQGNAAPSRILFSVTNDSAGLPLTAAELTSQGGVIFMSAGDAANTNTLFLDHIDLGLISADYEIDALTVLDQPLPTYTYGATCTLTDDPLSVDAGALNSYGGAKGLGPNVIVIHGANATGGDALAAYDAQTCAFLGRSDLPTGIAGAPWTIVPLPGWSAATPFQNVEHWRLEWTPAEAGTSIAELRRFDSVGVLVDTYLFDNTAPNFYGGINLIYEPTENRFFAVLDDGGTDLRFELMLVGRPAPGAPDDTPLSPWIEPILHPCASTTNIVGPDGRGNVLFSQRIDNTYSEHRVCSINADGEFASAPFNWLPNTAAPAFGLLGPTTAYLLHINGGSGPFQIERATMTLP